MDDSRLELGAWNRDSLAALSVYTSATPGFELGASPMAPIGPYAKDCCSQADTPVAVRRNATQIQQHCAARRDEPRDHGQDAARLPERAGAAHRIDAPVAV